MSPERVRLQYYGAKPTPTGPVPAGKKRIRMIVQTSRNANVAATGTVVDVSTATADFLITAGKAEEVEVTPS